MTQEIGQVFKIRLGLAEQPDVAQYWTLDSVRLHVVSEQPDVAQYWTLDSVRLSCPNVSLYKKQLFALVSYVLCIVVRS